MSFLTTEPAEIDDADASGRWSAFRERNPRTCLADLVAASRGSIPVAILSRDGGAEASGTIWAVDDVNGFLHLQLEDGAPAEAFVEQPAWAVFYLNEVKVQFALRNSTVHGNQTTRTLRVDLPLSLYRLKRRKTTRVRAAEGRSAVTLSLPPGVAPARLALMDLSLGGCSFWLPDTAAPPEPGAQLAGVEVALDGTTPFTADLLVVHVCEEKHGVSRHRVGCAWLRLPEDGTETLRMWIIRGQQRRDFVALTLDL